MKKRCMMKKKNGITWNEQIQEISPDTFLLLFKYRWVNRFFFFFLIFWVLWVTWCLLMWRRGYLASCPGGEDGSISRSYCDTRHSRPLMSSHQQAAGAEKTWGLSRRRPGVSRLVGVSIHSQCRLFRMTDICTWTERRFMPFKTVDKSGRWEPEVRFRLNIC